MYGCLNVPGYTLAFAPSVPGVPGVHWRCTGISRTGELHMGVRTNELRFSHVATYPAEVCTLMVRFCPSAFNSRPQRSHAKPLLHPPSVSCFRILHSPTSALMARGYVFRNGAKSAAPSHFPRVGGTDPHVRESARDHRDPSNDPTTSAPNRRHAYCQARYKCRQVKM